MLKIWFNTKLISARRGPLALNDSVPPLFSLFETVLSPNFLSSVRRESFITVIALCTPENPFSRLPKICPIKGINDRISARL